MKSYIIQNMYPYVIFDLDGTLTDPYEGITNSVSYALEKMNIKVPEQKVLQDFIGPTLKDSFQKWFSLTGEENERAIALYREYYKEKGIEENRLYPGMDELLSRLQKKGILLAVASSKPEHFVHRVLKSFDIEKYFSVIAGATDDGEGGTKEAVLGRAINLIREKEGYKARGSNILMVGDRRFDVEAAEKLGIASCAVSYGYGEEDELVDCRPTYIADETEDLYFRITDENPRMIESKPAIFKTLHVLMPLLIYWVIELGIFNLCLFGVTYYFKPQGESLERIKVYLNAVAAIATWPYLARCFYLEKGDPAPIVTRRKRAKILREGPYLVAFSMALALGLNILFASRGFSGSSESYQRVAASQYSVGLFVGLVIYGILMPFTEELLFRGIIQKRIAGYFPEFLVISLSALIFGCYHGNPVQILYAFLMGLALALVYQCYEHIAAPVVMHCSANLLIYFLSKRVGFSAAGPVVAMGAALVGVAMAVSSLYIRRLIQKRKRKGY